MHAGARGERRDGGGVPASPLRNPALPRCSGVLGDRRLTFNWGGSVLDSVIGVFLTQVEC